MSLKPSRTKNGFTLVEMLIVVALVGILATLALPSYKYATTKAREAVLMEDLFTFRDLIDQFYADQGRYPSSLEELVTTGYLRMIPVDPITEQRDWVEILEEISDELDVEPGIYDVQSASEKQALDGSYYYEW